MSTQLIEPVGLVPPLLTQTKSAWSLSSIGFHARQRRFALMLSFLLLLGAAVRIYPTAGFKKWGFDEGLYRVYVQQISLVGIARYPVLIKAYISEQTELASETYLPPTRLLYIVSGYAWTKVFHCGPLAALRAVSCLFSILTLGLCALWSLRLAGRTICLTTVALMACAPVEIHLAQHGMIDGFFAFWSLLAAWALWENMRAPEKLGWQLCLGGALAAMVLTKENAFFVYVALLGLIGLNWKLRYGTVTPRLLVVMFVGPLLGTAVLLLAAGGLGQAIEVYTLLITKASVWPYAVKYCDGPWYRYVMDLLLTSPLILLISVAGAFRVRFADKASLYFLGLIVVSYVIMCNLKYGINLRYATVWDFPMRYLAAGQLMIWSRAAGKQGRTLLIVLISGICLYELRQYYILFIKGELYELITLNLLCALDVIKP